MKKIITCALCALSIVDSASGMDLQKSLPPVDSANGGAATALVANADPQVVSETIPMTALFQLGEYRLCRFRNELLPTTDQTQEFTYMLIGKHDQQTLTQEPGQVLFTLCELISKKYGDTPSILCRDIANRTIEKKRKFTRIDAEVQNVSNVIWCHLPNFLANTGIAVVKATKRKGVTINIDGIPWKPEHASGSETLPVKKIADMTTSSEKVELYRYKNKNITHDKYQHISYIDGYLLVERKENRPKLQIVPSEHGIVLEAILHISSQQTDNYVSSLQVVKWIKEKGGEMSSSSVLYIFRQLRPLLKKYCGMDFSQEPTKRLKLTNTEPLTINIYEPDNLRKIQTLRRNTAVSYISDQLLPGVKHPLPVNPGEEKESNSLKDANSSKLDVLLHATEHFDELIGEFNNVKKNETPPPAKRPRGNE